jgi:hypothetical protein
MRDSDRPRFDLGVEAHIEMVQNQADEVLTQHLSTFLVAINPINPPHKRPMQMLSFIAAYARTLYISEGQQYPQDPRLEVWHQKLTKRIVARTMKIVSNVEAISLPRQCDLRYHGVSDAQIRKTARDEVDKLIRKRMTPTPPRMAAEPPLEVRGQMAAYAASGVDIPRGSPLLTMIAATAGRRAKPQVFAPVPPQATESPDVIHANRRSVIEPLLEAKGWSVLDWSKDAKVAHATAMDYLDEKTRPYADTRLKLAKSLGISVDRLPR